jgi:hypothetical protein
MSCRATQAARFALLALLFCATMSMAQVSPNTLFQLDGNAAQSPSAGFPSYPFTCVYSKGPAGNTCDYWNLLNGGGGSSIVEATGGANDHWDARTFINGTASTNSFIGGGSKDFNDIPQWSYSNHSTPDKDTLNAGYAAAYTAPGGHFETIFGADRLSPNGDANIGIWFFQQTVVPCPQPAGSPNVGACTGVPAGKFSGNHENGDILVISAFTGGGGKSGVAVYRWNNACTSSHYPSNPAVGACSDTNLEFRGSVAAAQACTNASGFCGVTNAAVTTSTWEGPIASPLFFEGGVDITYAIGGAQAPCFTSFMVDTRSSQSTSAVLKDFLGGGFPVCSVAVTKDCSACSLDNGTPTFGWDVNGTVSNTGSGTLYNVRVVDNAGTPNVAGDDISFTCGTLSVGQTKKWGSTAVSGDCTDDTGHHVQSTTQNPITNGAKAFADTAASNGTSIDATASKTCGACQVSPSLSVGKTCDTSVAADSGAVKVRIDYRGDVTNDGTLTLSNVGLAEDDNADGSFACKQLFTKDNANNFTVACGSPGSLDANNQCINTSCSLTPGQVAHFSGAYFANAFSSATPGRAQFNDTVKASATTGFGTVTPQTTTAHCLLCPPGSAECPLQ